MLCLAPFDCNRHVLLRYLRCIWRPSRHTVAGLSSVALNLGPHSEVNFPRFALGSYFNWREVQENIQNFLKAPMWAVSLVDRVVLLEGPNFPGFSFLICEMG